MNNHYKNFLIEELPKLKAFKLPFYRRTRKSKHDTLRHVLKKGLIKPDGLFAEFGVFKGITINVIAKHYPKADIYGFDSFEGFPDDGRGDWQHDFSVQGKLPDVPDNVTLIKGFFEDTLKDFAAQHAGQSFSFLHVDCDIYSSTKTIFKELGHMIQPGCIVVFDELLHYKGFEDNEIKAFHEFLVESKREFEWVCIRNKVMEFEDYAKLTPEELTNYQTMKQWRAMGYEQEVAVRIL